MSPCNNTIAFDACVVVSFRYAATVTSVVCAMRACCSFWRRRRHAYTTVDNPRPLPTLDLIETRPQTLLPKRLQSLELVHDVTHQTAIAYDAATQRVAVASTDNSFVDVLDVRTGQLLQRLGGRGVEAGLFWSPSALAFDATGRNTLLVGERNGGQRVQDMRIDTKCATRAFALPGGISALAANSVVVAVGAARADADNATVIILCAHSFIPLHTIGAREIHGAPVTHCAALALDVAGQTRVWVSEAAGSRVYACVAFTLDGRAVERLKHDALITQLVILSEEFALVADSVSAGAHVLRRTSARHAFQYVSSLYAPELQLAGVSAPVFLCNSASRPDVVWLSDAAFTRRRCLALHELRLNFANDESAVAAT